MPLLSKIIEDIASLYLSKGQILKSFWCKYTIAETLHVC